MDLIATAYIVAYLACGVSIVIRSRGLPRLLGGVAFTLLASSSIVRRLLVAMEVEFREYSIAFTAVRFIGLGCLFTALLTLRIGNEEPAVPTDHSTTGVDPQST